jgi:hypothetical protein
MTSDSGKKRAFTTEQLDRLPWRRLAELSITSSLPAYHRILAGRRLALRVEGLSQGERISLARIAARELLQTLAVLREPRVIEALLGNPRITAGVVLKFCTDPKMPGEALRLVAAHHRWSRDSGIREALLIHLLTPVHAALTLLKGMKEPELRRLLQREAVPGLIEIQAQRRLDT